jgi:hypothetical protein
MATVYARRFNLKDSLTDGEVAEFWKYAVDEFLPACLEANGVRDAKFYSGLADFARICESCSKWTMRGCTKTFFVILYYMNNVAKFYAAMDFKTSTQLFAREVTPQLVRALTP